MNLSDLFGGGEAAVAGAPFTSIWSGTGLFSQTTIATGSNILFYGVLYGGRYTGSGGRSTLTVTDGTTDIYRTITLGGENNPADLYPVPYQTTTDLKISNTIVEGSLLDFRVLVYYKII